MAAGFTMSLPEKDKTHMSKTEMYETIVGLLGGRVAEELTQEDICTGASNDLERSTSLARSMVTKYGLSPDLGPVVYGKAEHEVFLGRDFNQEDQYSEKTAQLIDSGIKSTVEKAYDECRSLLNEHMDQLVTVAEYLIKHEKVEAHEFLELIGVKTIPEKASQEAQAEVSDVQNDVQDNAQPTENGDSAE